LASFNLEFLYAINLHKTPGGTMVAGLLRGAGSVAGWGAQRASLPVANVCLRANRNPHLAGLQKLITSHIDRSHARHASSAPAGSVGEFFAKRAVAAPPPAPVKVNPFLNFCNLGRGFPGLAGALSASPAAPKASPIVVAPPAPHARSSSFSRLPAAGIPAGLLGLHGRRSSLHLTAPVAAAPILLPKQLPDPKPVESPKTLDVMRSRQFEAEKKVLRDLLEAEKGVIDFCPPSDIEKNLEKKVNKLRTQYLSLRAEILNAKANLRDVALRERDPKAFLNAQKTLRDLKAPYQKLENEFLEAGRALKGYRFLLDAPKKAKNALEEAKRIRDEHVRDKSGASVIEGARETVKNKVKALDEAKSELAGYYTRMLVRDCRSKVIAAKLAFVKEQREHETSGLEGPEVAASVLNSQKKMDKAVHSALHQLEREVSTDQYNLEKSRIRQIDCAVNEKQLKLQEAFFVERVEQIYKDWMNLPVNAETAKAECMGLFVKLWADTKIHMKGKFREEMFQAKLGKTDVINPNFVRAMRDQAVKALFDKKVELLAHLAKCGGFFSVAQLAKQFNRPELDIRKAANLG
jgi:hypothetical protein